MTEEYKNNPAESNSCPSIRPRTAFKKKEIRRGRRPFASRSHRHRFDFEVGYLVKSPCKTCQIREVFPRCLDTCETLSSIHSELTECVSCTRRG